MRIAISLNLEINDINFNKSKSNTEYSKFCSKEKWKHIKNTYDYISLKY